MSVLWFMKPKPLGKVRRRVQDLRISSASLCALLPDRPVLDLSHNESARLAVDCLLSQGLTGYHEALKTEGEVDILSEPEKKYILENRRDGNTDTSTPEDESREEWRLSSPSSMTPTDSSSTVEELDSPEEMKATNPASYKSTEIFLSRAAGMKDLVRQFISKAEQTLVVVTDSFSDTELLCDLLEVSRKRNVSVYLLLDHLKLELFTSTWKGHQLNSKDFPKLSVRSVQGQTYCSKTGRKLTGQIAESFIITDWTEVLTGSYSFTWLSWQVHRSLAVLLKGSSIRPFHQEVHRLYSSSEPVAGFVNFLPAPLPPHLHSSTADHNTDICKQRSNQTKTVHHWEGNGARRQAWTNSTTIPLTGESHGDNQPPVLQTCLAEQELEGREQNPSLEKPQNMATPDQISSDFVPQFINSSFSPAAEKSKWIKESNALHSACKTYMYERLQKKNSNLSPYGFHAFKHSGLAEALNTQQGHWNQSNFQLKVEVPPDNSNFYPALQAKPILQSAFSSSRGQASQPNTDFSYQQPARMVTHLRIQPHAEPKLYPPLQTHMYQRVNLLPRSNWTQQNYQSAGPRAVVRQHSFSGAHMTGQQGWRSLQRTVNASLERSKSMNERGATGL